MKKTVSLIIATFLLALPLVLATRNVKPAAILPNSDRAAIEETGQAIRAAFARGDVATVMAYHHPDVVKALSYDKYLNGRDAVEADLRGTLQSFNLEFIENRVESILIQGETAVEQTVFTIKGTPKHGGEPFMFKGRTMVVYVKYKKSPSGWASIRELIQPAPSEKSQSTK